ncbi:predicted protein [Ostreococcus lucimarinus CCE9901]|uniref:Uncharacterized protein n=1 Tax=Ostreococcus lucimarinus (strain CCE9901) TaxID=436017 RepID=A4S706_OSTLU|nr:predicted protein [Ostreococcus lucimarinus CCE9901]ABO99664.1 predicted protein [Ostreococcus lucimarinus CCE9901]|eukprot:XP_001421371.1 predicted protein [Ostreococcus lucimarinus CCE9901]
MAATRARDVGVLMANLGYLPAPGLRADERARRTRTEASTSARLVRAGTRTLRLGGVFTVVAYLGHDGGAEENEAVRRAFAELSPKDFTVVVHAVVNRKNAPVLLEIDDAKKDPFDVLATRARRDDDATTRAPPNISRPEQSPLLGKLATFLPSLASANEALATKTASEVNIEVASDDDGAARIEMDLGLGVVDLKTDDAVRVAAKRAGVAHEETRDEVKAETLVVPTKQSGAASKNAKRSKKMIEEL